MTFRRILCASIFAGSMVSALSAHAQGAGTGAVVASAGEITSTALATVGTFAAAALIINGNGNDTATSGTSGTTGTTGTRR